MPFQCKDCGSEIANKNAKFCKHCGAQLSKEKSHHEISAVQYPSLWRRYFSHMLDILAAYPFFFLVGAILGGIGFSGEIFDINPVADWFFTSIFFICYMAYFESRCGSSIGKWFFNLKVSDEDGRRIDFRTAAYRNSLKIIPYVPIVELFVALRDPRKQSLHDRWQHTLVIDMHTDYTGEHQTYQKRTGQKLLAVLGILLFTFVFFSLTDSAEEDVDDLLRYGVRDIQNRMLLNTDLFTKEPKKKEFSDSPFKGQLAAIVSILCVDDDEEEIGGSGVMISEDGLILTNKHVVENVTENYCLIGFTNDPALPPDHAFLADTVFSMDEDFVTLHGTNIDAAIIRIVGALEGFSMPDAFPMIPTSGSSDDLSFGDAIYVIGYPGFGGGTLTLTKGIMSGRFGDDYIKTSAKIDSGNSGGAAVNELGELIGIPTFILSGTSEGLGYIIGIDSIFEWLSPLLNDS